MFRTELSIAPATDQLARTARVLTVGSCFADSIGSRLAANKVETLVNPFGTVFQPLALGRLLRAAAGEEVDWQRHLVEARGRWQSYDLHGSIGAGSPVELLQVIHELVRRTGEFLRTADVALLTLGTAWVYRLRETGELVSNCHKQPADLFVRELLTPDDIINGLAETHAYLRRINPALRFVLTVSPVRHLKETLPLNAVSKSVLRVATHFISDLLPGVAYFPAYELLTDDLRDYRFYAADMLHPSEVAEEYIWDKFARTYFDVEFGRFRKDWAAVRRSLEHRPLHAAAPEHRQFLESTLDKLEQLSLRKVSVATELQAVRTQLAALPAPELPKPLLETEDDEERIDIGEGTTSSAAVGLGLPSDAAAESRPERLSPEEFRNQRSSRSGRGERGRRDGRGKGQAREPSENEQFQTASIAADLPQTLVASPTPSDVAGDTEREAELMEAPTSSTQPAASGNAADDDPSKKKKRRSRGGAKRTARKNALRLAAEATPEGSSDTNEAPDMRGADAPTESSNEPDESNTPSVVANSVPVKRGDRRNEAGRVPRVALFTAASDASAVEPLTSSDDTAIGEPNAASVAIATSPTGTESVLPATSRSKRSRGGRKSPAELSTPGGTSAETSIELEVSAPNDADTGFAQNLLSASAGAPASAMQEEGRSSQPVTHDAPTAKPNDDSSAATVAPAAPVAARKSSRAKRAISGARPEKPAVDTPVIPVADASQQRTQVAAGRMTGSSASLVTPKAAAKKPAAAKPDAAVKKPATRQTKLTAAPLETAEPETAPAPLPKQAAQPKPAVKKKSSPPKATAAKAPRKPAKPAS